MKLSDAVCKVGKDWTEGLQDPRNQVTGTCTSVFSMGLLSRGQVTAFYIKVDDDDTG